MPRSRTQPTRRSRNPVVASAQKNVSELDSYDNAMRVVESLLSPHAPTASRVPSYGMFGPVNHVDPRTVTTLNLDSPFSQGDFTALVYPFSSQQLWVTDSLAQLPRKWRAERVFDHTGKSISDLLPPGKSINTLPLRGSANVWMELDFMSQDRSAMLFSVFDPAADGFVSRFGALSSSVPGVRFRASIDGTFRVYSDETTFTDHVVTAGAYTTISPATKLYSLMYKAAFTPTASFHVELEFANDNATSGPWYSQEVLYNVPTDLFDEFAPSAINANSLGTTLLASFTGSSELNGGVIAARRFPRNAMQMPVSTERYDWLASKPGSKVGPLCEGAFAPWIPENLPDFEGNSVYAFDRFASCAVICGHIDNKSQRIQLVAESRIRFTTLSRAYQFEHPITDPLAWTIALNALRLMPGGCCNPDHLSKIKKVMKLLYDHRKQIASGAKSAGAVALKVAPLIAAAMV